MVSYIALILTPFVGSGFIFMLSTCNVNTIGFILALPTYNFSISGINFAVLTYNFAFRTRQQWSGQVSARSVFTIAVVTLFIDGIFGDTGIKECSSEELLIVLSTCAASHYAEQTCRVDPTSHSNAKDHGQGRSQRSNCSILG